MIEYAYRDSLRPRKNRLTSCTIVSKKVLSIKATKKLCCFVRVDNSRFTERKKKLAKLELLKILYKLQVFCTLNFVVFP